MHNENPWLSKRIKIQDSLSGRRITIEPNRSIKNIVFLFVWLCIWMLGELWIVSQIPNYGNKTSFGITVLGLWFLGWTMGGLLALYGLHSELLRLVVLELTPVSITKIEHNFLGLKTQNYDIFRMGPIDISEKQNNNSVNPTTIITFTYDEEPEEIGLHENLNREQAQLIINEIKTVTAGNKHKL